MQAIKTQEGYFEAVAPYMPWILGVALILAVVLTAAAILIVRAGRKESREEKAAEKDGKAGEEEAGRDVSSAGMRETFRKAMHVLRTLSPGQGYRFSIPWILMLGESGSGKTKLLEGSELGRPLRHDRDIGMTGGRLGFFFFQGGMVIDPSDGVVLGTGKERQSNAFDRLLRLFVWHRARRPLDGIVVTVPACELEKAADDGGQGLRALKAAAERMYERLRLAQRITGMRLPVYVLVTRCDGVEGFGDFCAALPAASRNGIFGWSNPHTPDVEYVPEWLKDAFSSVCGRIDRARRGLFGECRELDSPDGLYFFRERLTAIFPALSEYVGGLFRQSVYHEPFFFRGIYFSGNGAGGETVFAKELFERKIFPERTLAVPVKRALVARTRLVRALQVAAVGLLVVWGGLMWSGYGKLAGEAGSIRAFLEEVAVDVRERNGGLWDSGRILQMDALKKLARNSPRTNAELKKSAREHAEGMARVSTSRLWAAGYLSSWFSPLHGRIRQAMRESFDRIIMRALLVGLVRKAQHIYTPEVVPRQDSPAVLAPGRTPEFADLVNFVNSAAEFRTMAGKYNDLGATSDIEELVQLYRYAFDVQLPTTFYSNSGYYRTALHETVYQTIPPDAFAQEADAAFSAYAGAFFRRIFGRNPLERELCRLRSELEGAETGKGRLSESAGAEAFAATVAGVGRLVADPASQWMGRHVLDLGPEFADLWSRAQEDTAVTKTAADEEKRTAAREFAALRKRLASIGTRQTGPFLVQEDGSGTLALSPAIAGLSSSMNTLEEMPFMRSRESAALQASVPPASRVIWDERALASAVDMISQFERFVNSRPEDMPAGLKNAVSTAGGASLGDTLAALVADAQSFQPGGSGFSLGGLEEDLRVEVGNFGKAAPFLLRILGAFESLGRMRDYSELAAFADRQALSLLAKCDSLLDRDRLYGVDSSSLNAWMGRRPASFAAFGVDGENGLSRFLSSRRQRMEYLANSFAEPVLVYIYQRPDFYSGNDESSVVRWALILEQLDAYQAKQPGSSLAELEEFVTSSLNGTDSGDCQEKLAPFAAFGSGGDYFLDARMSAARAVMQRCRYLALRQFATRYAKIADYFNAHLAGKYPFAAPAAFSGEQADPAVIKYFLSMASGLDSEAQAALAGAGGKAGDVLAFVRDMAVLGKFFGCFANREKANAPVYGVDAFFRTEPESEVDANQIIGWKLEVGDDSLEREGQTAGGVWTYGAPVKLALRWAENSPWKPEAGKDFPGRTVAAGSVTYSYDNAWSLLALLRNNSAGPEDLSVYRQPEAGTLVFRTQTRFMGTAAQERADEAGWPAKGEGGEAKVFVRVRLNELPEDPKKQPLPTPLTLPSGFPVRAPALDADAVWAEMRKQQANGPGRSEPSGGGVRGFE